MEGGLTITEGMIHSYESLGALDGPGLRLCVYFSGCPLRCLFCHNPDTWQLRAGTRTSAEEVVRRAKRFRPYFANGGGITLSGGEPLMQPEFALEILKGCRKAGISTCVDTSGGTDGSAVRAALEYADLVMLDVKHTDDGKYRVLTGGCPDTHRSFLRHCREKRIPLWIRQVILPGWTDTPRDIEALLRYIEGAEVRKVELLPYHTLGVHTWAELGLQYELAELRPPDDARMQALREIVALKWKVENGGGSVGNGELKMEN